MHYWLAQYLVTEQAMIAKPIPELRCLLRAFMAPISNYVLYQESFRGIGIRATIQAEWAAKTPAQKKAWRDAYNKVCDQEDLVQDLDTDVHHERIAYDDQYKPGHGNLLIANKAERARFVEQVAIVRKRYDSLAKEYWKLSECFDQLVGIEANQNMIQASTDHGEDGARNARRRFSHFRSKAQEMKTVQDEIPVVLDPWGRRRIPGAWLSNSQAELRHRQRVAADVGSGALRAVIPGLGRWVPEFALSGGMSIGWIWLRVDDNDIILDVSRWNDPEV